MKHLQPDTLIQNPQGRPVVSSVDIDGDAQRAWALVGNFGGFNAFIPALSHIEMIGEGIGGLRKKHFKDGHLVVEQLNSRDEQAMCMTWTTIYNTLGIGNLWAGMTVEALEEGRCRATWRIIAQPAQPDRESAAFETFVQAFADSAMENVRLMLR